MEKVKKSLLTIAVFCSGVTMASLWITHSEHWKITLPTALACLLLKEVLQN
jgi:hypothetical protein